LKKKSDMLHMCRRDGYKHAHKIASSKIFRFKKDTKISKRVFF
jgi:hypothetical protein